MVLGTEPGGQHNSPVRPLLAGDLVAGSRVAGFAWVGPAEGVVSTHLDDRLVLEGDERLAAPPDRPVPQTADGAEPLAAVPPTDLPARCLHPAESLGVTLPFRAGALVDLPGAPWRPLIRPLFGAVHAAGHRVWLTGGAVRDLVVGVPLHEVNDLDLSGTVPPGRFTDITRQTLRAMGMAELRTTVTPTSLVCSVVDPRSARRLIEYRGLSKGGFSFPVVGSQLAEDADYRDFAFNALLYDVLDDVVFDPSGKGLADLLGEKRRFTPHNVSTDPFTQAETIVRAGKLALRWANGARLTAAPLDLEPLTTWISALPRNLCQMLTAAHWNGLRSVYRRAIHAPLQRQQEFAASLPQPGKELIEILIGEVR